MGLVGFPNAGKSTLISRISAARPKIAAYPFTTLEPHLGVVSADPDALRATGRTFVVADLPGLIEGAHEGAGLGTRFLKHMERTRLIAHLVDTSDANDRDPVQDFEIIEHELASFSPQLAEKPMIVVATKLDATTNREHLEELRAYAAKRNLEFHAISSATGEGIVPLVRAMADALDRIPKPASPAIAPDASEPHALPAVENPAFRTAREISVDVTRRTQIACVTRGPRTVARIAACYRTRSLPSRFLAAHSIPFMPDTSLWRKQCSADFISTSIHFIPSSRPPHKSRSELTPFVHRYAMVALACAEHPGFLPSLAEAPVDGATPHVFYTVDTVRRFRREHPDDHIYFIVGADQFLEIPTWKNYEALLDLLRFHHRQPARFSN